MRRPLVLLALLPLAACAEPLAPADLARIDRRTCEEAGFAQGADAFRLCLLIQDQNRRIGHLESEVTRLGIRSDSLLYPRSRYYR